MAPWEATPKWGSVVMRKQGLTRPAPPFTPMILCRSRDPGVHVTKYVHRHPGYSENLLLKHATSLARWNALCYACCARRARKDTLRIMSKLHLIRKARIWKFGGSTRADSYQQYGEGKNFTGQRGALESSRPGDSYRASSHRAKLSRRVSRALSAVCHMYNICNIQL